ncbi:MAG: hypothetical protein R6V84_11035, partial [Desulfobacterales bacterium]
MVARFRHHRGNAEAVELEMEARLLLDWIHHASGARIHGRALDDTVVLLGPLEPRGRTAVPGRFAVRARLLADDDAGRPRSARAPADDEPSLTLSLY